MSEAEPATEARRIAQEARDRARFEDEALGLAEEVGKWAELKELVHKRLKILADVLNLQRSHRNQSGCP